MAGWFPLAQASVPPPGWLLAPPAEPQRKSDVLRAIDDHAFALQDLAARFAGHAPSLPRAAAPPQAVPAQAAAAPWPLWPPTTAAAAPLAQPPPLPARVVSDRLGDMADELWELTARLEAVAAASKLLPAAASTAALAGLPPVKLDAGPLSGEGASGERGPSKGSSDCTTPSRGGNNDFDYGTPLGSHGCRSISKTSNLSVGSKLESRAMSKLNSFAPSDAEERLKMRGNQMRRKSQEKFWARAEHTIIIFDYDDTFFPTSWAVENKIMQEKEPRSMEGVGEILQECADLTISILRLARASAERVVLVTLAKPEWLKDTIETCVPELSGQFEELGVKVVYAREVMQDTDWGDSANDPEFWACAKAEAIFQECETFYSRHNYWESWKNVVAVGDSDLEIEGSKRVVQEWAFQNRRFAQQLPRLKALKLLQRPTGQQLVQQLQVLERLLPTLTALDRHGDITIDFANIRNNFSLESATKLVMALPNKELPAQAIIECKMWKLSNNADPTEPDSYRPRRVWLSPTGKLWYESMKVASPTQVFEGTRIDEIEIKAVGIFALAKSPMPPECAMNPCLTFPGCLFFGMQFTRRLQDKNADDEEAVEVAEPGADPTQTTTTRRECGTCRIFATESNEERTRWMTACAEFEPQLPRSRATSEQKPFAKPPPSSSDLELDRPSLPAGRPWPGAAEGAC